MLEVMAINNPTFCRILFNTSANVGIGQPNDGVDVQLVQFGYACRAKNPRSSSSQAAKAIYATVIPGSQYFGRPDEPLSQAIIIDQKERGGIQDGHVSRMHGGFKYQGPRGEHGFMLISVSNNIYDINPDVWPRIDYAPGCPSALAAAVKMLFRND